MRHMVLRLSVALFTFVIGVSFAISYRAVTLHRVNVLLAREAVLRQDLFQMRSMIDQYAVDKGSRPKSLDDLVRAGYLRELHEDTFTRQRDWVVVISTEPNLSENLDGIIDVHSASLATSLEGTPYKEW
jgi:general secretion pathway protein G